MLNYQRRIDIAIFTIKTSIFIGDVQIQPGLNQIIRQNDKYFFKKVGESSHYAEVPILENSHILKIVFSQYLF